MTTTEKIWTHKGLKCKVMFVHGSHRCGYVRIPKSVEWSSLDYDDIPVDIHGGLTFKSVEKDGVWFGFDCAHAGDAMMRDGKLKTYFGDGSTEHFWTLEEVVKETESLADQLSRITWDDIIKAKMSYMPDWFSSRVMVLNDQAPK